MGAWCCWGTALGITGMLSTVCCSCFHQLFWLCSAAAFLKVLIDPIPVMLFSSQNDMSLNKTLGCWWSWGSALVEPSQRLEQDTRESHQPLMCRFGCIKGRMGHSSCCSGSLLALLDGCAWTQPMASTPTLATVPLGPAGPTTPPAPTFPLLSTKGHHKTVGHGIWNRGFIVASWLTGVPWHSHSPGCLPSYCGKAVLVLVFAIPCKHRAWAEVLSCAQVVQKH